MTTPDARRRHIVGARKIPTGQRDVAHAVITPEDPRGFADVIDADDDPAVPDGADVAYAVDLTDAEAEVFRAASNCRYVEPDQQRRMAVVDAQPVLTADAVTAVPPAATMTYMGAGPDVAGSWHGRDVPVAVLDGGTSAAVKTRFGWTVVAHRNFTSADQSPDLTTVEHGCWVSPLAVPAGGRLVQAVVFDAQGSAYDSQIAAAIKWAVDAGARVINFSGGGGGPSSALADGMRYAQARGAVVVCSAGNSGEPNLEYPARYSEAIPGCRSSIAFTEATDLRASFSNYAATGSGCAPGDQVLTIGRDGGPVRVSGTSFSAPHMARLVAMGATGGTYKPLAVADALQATARNTPAPSVEEGAGAWHLDEAIAALQAATPAPVPVPVPPPSPAPAPLPPLAVQEWAERTVGSLWRAKRDRDAARLYLDWLTAR